VEQRQQQLEVQLASRCDQLSVKIGQVEAQVQQQQQQLVVLPNKIEVNQQQQQLVDNITKGNTRR
jgi:hypothetical protein